MRGPLPLTDWTQIISRGFFTLVGGRRGGPEKKKGIDRDRVESFLQAYRYGRVRERNKESSAKSYSNA